MAEPTHLKNILVKLDHLPRDRGENKKISEVSPPRVVNGSKLVGSPTYKGVYWGYNPFTNHLLTSWDIQVGERECIFNLKILWPEIIKGEDLRDLQPGDPSFGSWLESTFDLGFIL